MKRRNFLRNSSIATIAVAGMAATACHTANHSSPKKEENNASNANDFVDDFSLNEATISQLQQMMQTGKQTARSLAESYLKRINELDKAGPNINAVIEKNPDVLAIADALDAERKAGKIRGPLHGIPILIKDNIDTADQMMTTAGALAMLGNKATKDAHIVSQLRAAGAVLLGKTNLSEWANFRSTHSTSGWSSRGGQTKNPVMLTRNPCGSSSGSGAAVAANFCAVAVGTETDGSVIAPASFCGIVGIKPTVGLVSRAGIIPISATQDTAGPMARTVTDAAILLTAMAGADDADAVTKNNPNKTAVDYSKSLATTALQGKRIGMETSFLKGSEGVVKLYQAAMEQLKKLGATIVEIELLKATSENGSAENTVMQFEFKDGVNKYLAAHNAPVKTLADVIDFNKKNADKAMPYFKQETLEACNQRKGIDEVEYKNAVAKTIGCRKIINDMMQKNKLDAICGTSYGPATLTDLVNGDYDPGFYFCPPASMAGYPHITVPMGKVQQLPVGLSFVASAYQEATIIGFAYAYEQATKHRQAPQFLNG